MSATKESHRGQQFKSAKMENSAFTCQKRVHRTHRRTEKNWWRLQ